MVGFIAKIQGFDIVHGQNQLATYAAILGRGVSGAKVIFDAHGVGPEEVAALGKSLNFDARRIEEDTTIWREVERACWTRADGVLAVSNALVDHYRTTYGDADVPLAIVPCAAQESAFGSISDRDLVRRQLGVTQDQVFLYVGSLQHYQMVPEMLEWFARLRRDRPNSFLLVVSQSSLAEWERDIRAAGIPEGRFRTMSVAPAAVPALAAAGDIGIMFKQDSMVSAVASPVKLGEYLAAGVPVMTNGTVRDATAFIREKNVGWAGPTAGIPTVSAIAPFLASIENDRTSWSERCVAAARDFLSWKVIGPRIAGMYEMVLLNRPGSRSSF